MPPRLARPGKPILDRFSGEELLQMTIRPAIIATDNR